jgi:hypothetical protein
MIRRLDDPVVLAARGDEGGDAGEQDGAGGSADHSRRQCKERL